MKEKVCEIKDFEIKVLETKDEIKDFDAKSSSLDDTQVQGQTPAGMDHRF